MAQRERERDKKRERKGRKNRKYGQAKLKHAKRGILSCMAATAVCIILALLLITAYASGGQSAPVIGGFGLVSFILACVGLYVGVKGFREREKDYLTCKIGVSACGFFILMFIIIFCRGLL